MLQRAAAASPGNVGLRVIFAGAGRPGPWRRSRAATARGGGDRATRDQASLSLGAVLRAAEERRCRRKGTARRGGGGTGSGGAEARAGEPDRRAALVRDGREEPAGADRLGPEEPGVAARSGPVLRAHQRPALAEEVYRKVVAAGGSSAQALTARNRVAALALEANRSAEASALINEILEASPRDNDALTMRANIALARGDTTGAIADLRAVLRDQPNAASADARTRRGLRGQSRCRPWPRRHCARRCRANPTDIQTRLALADLLDEEWAWRPRRSRLPTSWWSSTRRRARDRGGVPRAAAAKGSWRPPATSAREIQTLRPDLPAGPFLLGLVDEAEGKLARRAQPSKWPAVWHRRPSSRWPRAARIDPGAGGRQQRALNRVDKALAAAPGSQSAAESQGGDSGAGQALRLNRLDAAGQAIAQLAGMVGALP